MNFFFDCLLCDAGVECSHRAVGSRPADPFSDQIGEDNAVMHLSAVSYYYTIITQRRCMMMLQKCEPPLCSSLLGITERTSQWQQAGLIETVKTNPVSQTVPRYLESSAQIRKAQLSYF